MTVSTITMTFAITGHAAETVTVTIPDPQAGQVLAYLASVLLPNAAPNDNELAAAAAQSVINGWLANYNGAMMEDAAAAARAAVTPVAATFATTP
jgi:hypothetical protein